MSDVLTVLCNNPASRLRKRVLRLAHDEGDPNRNVKIALPAFVRNVYHLPDHVLDLIETAAFVYAADRLKLRGPIDSLEYQRWARRFKFVQRCRNPDVWTEDGISGLSAALRWLTGDASYDFEFCGGHKSPPSSLFDTSTFELAIPKEGVAVLPFSGGLDSLAGALFLLETTNQHVCLVSHQTQPKTKRTQDALAEALARKYGHRVHHYRFTCHLVGGRAPEESQRSRSFLYCTIAYAVATAYRQPRIYMFENGVTSINLARRQDMLNARSSRTTHPQTLGRIAQVFSAHSGAPFQIEAPFLSKTKRDIVELILNLGGQDLISSAVSCTSTLKHSGAAPQCGECFQCIDRRLATFAANAAVFDDAGLYEVDFINEPVSSGVAKTTLVDYLRQSYDLYRLNVNGFHDSYLSELVELADWVPGSNEFEQLECVHDLATRHSEAVRDGLRAMQLSVDPYQPPAPNTILQLVATGEHTREAVERLANSVTGILEDAIPQMFRKTPPKDENDFNAKVGALLRTHYEKLKSENPQPKFACAGVVADHELAEADLIIESKYIRANTPPSKASDGLLADMMKYPEYAYILAVVLDLDRSIPDDKAFRYDIERVRRKAEVLILR